MSFIGKTYKKGMEFIAQRRLSTKESIEHDELTPRNWHTKLPIINKSEIPDASGYGYVQSPYISQWTKMWGVNPLADLSKYRMMFRTVPIVKKAINKTVATAMSKGFKLELSPDVPRREEILEYLTEWISKQEDFKAMLQMVAADGLIYGNSYIEIVYDEIDQEEKFDEEFLKYTIPDPQEKYKMGENNIPFHDNITVYSDKGNYLDVRAKGNPVWLKPLDPVWMRVRRDSFGNVFGYLQYLSTPPVAFTPEKVMHFRFNPKSWWTENAYGTSMLLSLIRTQEAIWQIENDLILISHACAKPPLIFSCGTDEEPWSEADLTLFVSETAGRGAAGDIYHRGDVESKPLPFPASSLAPLLAHLDYHVEQRMVALGVPPDLLGIHASSNRSTATVSFDDWINTIQQLQEQIGDMFEEQLFKEIIHRKFGEDVAIPRIVWNQVYEKDATTEVNKIIGLKSSNIITLNEARAWMEELGKKLGPLSHGDILGEPGVASPGIEQPKLKEPPFDNNLNDSDIFESAVAEYTDVDLDNSLDYDDEEEDALIAHILRTCAYDAEIDDMGLENNTHLNQLVYPLVKKDRRKKEFESSQANNVKINKLFDFDGLEFWLVSGTAIYKLIDAQWKNKEEKTQHEYIGGHHSVFDYIPENEIWISDMNPNPKHTATHEYVELLLMRDKGMDYSEAHRIAKLSELNLPEALKFINSYISPKEIMSMLKDKLVNFREKNGEWVDGNGRKITLDKTKGILYLKDKSGELKKKQLVRDETDVINFIGRMIGRKFKGE